MCLAVPGKIKEINGTTATVDIEGNEVTADVSIVPDASVGDYVIVHAGCAIQKYDEEEALETLKVLREFASGSEGE
ncbi:hypothetical protein BVY04_03725 [bacterium M21]|nr:hypothetical protein BVY04_03725 [bacterium M21]